MIFILMFVGFIVIMTLLIVGLSVMVNKPNIKPFTLKELVGNKRKNTNQTRRKL